MPDLIVSDSIFLMFRPLFLMLFVAIFLVAPVFMPGSGNVIDLRDLETNRCISINRLYKPGGLEYE